MTKKKKTKKHCAVGIQSVVMCRCTIDETVLAILVFCK